MKFQNKIIALSFCLSATLITLSCNKSEAISVYNPELVFTRSFEIEVAPYVYTDKTDDILYQVSGKTTLDTLGAQPEFRWGVVPSNIVTIAVFNEPMQVSGEEIQNPENIIWQWTSNMDSERKEVDGLFYTSVQYLQGKMVINKKIQYATQPLPLQSGLYYWAVWSWDEGGRWILYSTKPFKFQVE